jgi:transposase
MGTGTEMAKDAARIGRPTDFKPAYAEEILQLMATGLSLAAAAAELGIHRQRVYDWEEKHPEFADTIKLARSKRQLFLERRLLSATDGPVVTSSIFALKNAAGEDWRDKQEQEHTGGIRVEVVTFADNGR